MRKMKSKKEKELLRSKERLFEFLKEDAPDAVIFLETIIFNTRFKALNNL